MRESLATAHQPDLPPDALAGVRVAVVGAAARAEDAPAGLTKVTFVQEWPVADGFWIPWILGKEKGFYAEEGIDLDIQILRPRVTFQRMLDRQEFQVSELSLASYTALTGRGPCISSTSAASG